MLFSITPYATSFPDKGYLRMIENLLTTKHTAPWTEWSHRGEGVLTSWGHSVTHHTPGLSQPSKSHSVLHFPLEPFIVFLWVLCFVSKLKSRLHISYGLSWRLLCDVRTCLLQLFPDFCQLLSYFSLDLRVEVHFHPHNAIWWHSYFHSSQCQSSGSHRDHRAHSGGKISEKQSSLRTGTTTGTVLAHNDYEVLST